MNNNVMRNQGNMCHPCFRVYHGRYWPRHQIKNMPTFLGGNFDERKKFMDFRDHVITLVRTTRNKSIRVDWSAAEVLLHQSEDNLVLMYSFGCSGLVLSQTQIGFMSCPAPPLSPKYNHPVEVLDSDTPN
jgi:hypothetical protein